MVTFPAEIRLWKWMKSQGYSLHAFADIMRLFGTN